MGETDPRPVDVSQRPISFMLRYIRRHPVGHAVVLASVVLAVGCSIASQYSVKHLVDTLTAGQHGPVWTAFALLAGLIAADNMLWRVGGWMASHSFVAVTGDLRRDLFHHLTGHSPAYFADRPPGTLAGRITATGNAIYTVENTFAWNVLPPLLAVAGSIAVMLTVSPLMALVLVLVSAALAWMLSVLAKRGRPLHHQYAADAAAVDGELVDVINNMPLVRAFGATMRERQRFSDRVEQEMSTRGRSLRYLEKLRLFHAAVTAALTAGLLAWAITLWEIGSASPRGRRARHHARLHHPARHTGSCGGPGGHDPAYRPPVRGAGHAAAAARAAGRQGGARARQPTWPGRVPGRHLRLPGQQPVRARPLHPGGRSRHAGRARGALRLRQVHRAGPVAAPAGRAVRPYPSRRPRHRGPDAGEPA